MKYVPRDDERVMVFIDIKNLDIALAKMNPNYYKCLRIDYEEMVDNLVGSRRLVNAYIFDGISAENPNENVRFYDKLRSQGFIVLTTPNSMYDSGQKGVDVNLAINIVEGAILDKYDTAIVVSEDKDFVPAIEMARNRGKRVECAGFNPMSGYLHIRCDSWTDLNEMQIITCSQSMIDDTVGNQEEAVEEVQITA